MVCLYDVFVRTIIFYVTATISRTHICAGITSTEGALMEALSKGYTISILKSMHLNVRHTHTFKAYQEVQDILEK